MATVLRFQPTTMGTVSPQLVALRSRWQDPWTVVPELWCSQAVWSVNPSLPTAQLAHRYGVALWRLFSQFQQVERLHNRLRYYVRVSWVADAINADDETGGLRHWYGLLDVELDELHGPFMNYDEEEDAVVAVPNGKNHFTAYGLEALLDTVECNTSVVQGESGQEQFTVQRALPFNPKTPGTLKRRGNRSSAADNDGVYRFHDQKTGGLAWSTRDCVKYLLAHDAPRDYSGDATLPFVLLDSAEILPTWDDPELPRQDRTVRELLNALLSRQRLLGYRVRVEEPQDEEQGGGEIQIVPVSFASEELPLDSIEDAVFRANPDQRIVALEQDRTAEASIKLSAADLFDQVVVRGAQRTSTATFSFIDGTLDIGWTAEQEEKFEKGASEEDDYPPADDVERRQYYNEEARARDEVKRVFARFVLPEAFDGHVGDGESGDAGYILHPSDANEEIPEPLAPDDKRFETELPLLLDHDYSGHAIENEEFAEKGPGPHHHLHPLVLFRRPDWTEYVPRYRHAEKPSLGLEFNADNLATADSWSAHVHVDHHDGALWIELGQYQQLIAKTDFTRLPGEDYEVPADYRHMLATLTVPWSQYAEARYPEELAPQGVDGVRRMTLLLGDDYRADFVVQSTVVGLDPAGKLLRSETGGYVRDDRPKLAAIAKLAFQWYGRARRALSFKTSLINNALELGDLVESIGDPALEGDIHDDIGSVVTEIRLANPLAEGEGNVTAAAPSVTYTTAFGELDALQLRRSL